MSETAKNELIEIMEKLDEWLGYDEEDVDTDTWHQVNDIYHTLETLAED